MGIIQSAINQSLGTVGIAARLSPGFETRQELHKLGKQEKAITQLKEALPQISPEEYEEGKTVGAQTLKNIEAKESEIAQRQFELKPNKETMKKAMFSKSIATQSPLFTLPAEPEDIAMDRVDKLQEKQVKQKRRFMDYLKNLSTSIGGTVGELPANVQKLIASGYSKSERKKLMDTMDKEMKR